MGLGDGFHDRQAQARPARLAAARFVGAIEPIEDSLELLGTQAIACVLDAQP